MKDDVRVAAEELAIAIFRPRLDLKLLYAPDERARLSEFRCSPLRLMFSCLSPDPLF